MAGRVDIIDRGSKVSKSTRFSNLVSIVLDPSLSWQVDLSSLKKGFNASMIFLLSSWTSLGSFLVNSSSVLWWKVARSSFIKGHEARENWPDLKYSSAQCFNMVYLRKTTAGFPTSGLWWKIKFWIFFVKAGSRGLSIDGGTRFWTILCMVCKFSKVFLWRLHSFLPRRSYHQKLRCRSMNLKVCRKDPIGAMFCLSASMLCFLFASLLVSIKCSMMVSRSNPWLDTQ